MKCPSCEMNTDNTTYCQHCNTDLLLYHRINKMADRLYNKGLEQAQGRCLSGAIDTLLMCTHLQKKHINARNLLGLVYWEVGEVGEAIKQWVISVAYQKTENIANHYLKIIQNQPNQLSKYSDSILAFNKSLAYILGGSEDIAVISLRKVISQIPNYIEAKALLSLYYITIGQNNKAKELLEEIFLINKDHPKATRYWAQIQGDTISQKQTFKNVRHQQPSVRSFEPVTSKMADNMIKPKSIGAPIGAFVFGAICMLAVYAILIVPSKTADFKEQIKIAKENENSANSQLVLIQQEKEQAITNLEAENEILNKTNQTLEDEQTIQREILVFQEAQNLAYNNEWVESADKLYTVGKSILPEDIKVQYETLEKTVYPKAGEKLYRDGFSHFQKGEYSEAQKLLEKSHLYAKEEYFSHNALYTIGRSYEFEENNEKAKQYYQSVFEDYPGTDSAYNAKWRFDQLEK